jgi:hypothetical protein
MKNQKTTYIKDDEDTTLTLKILVGETFEDTIVTEKLSIDQESGEEFTHFTLETPSTEDQVYRTMAELAEEVDAEARVLAESLESLEAETDLIDELTVADPSSDALELELLESE